MTFEEWMIYYHAESPMGELGEFGLKVWNAAQAAERASSGIDKKLLAYKMLVKSIEARIAAHENNRLSYQEAMDTLESERECNARLTEELADRESSEEPLLWFETDESGEPKWDNVARFSNSPADIENAIPLYRHPPPARKLTDEEIQFMWGAHYRSELEDHYLQFARAIERRINGEEE